MVLEMGRRERATEDEVRELDGIKTRLESEKEGWQLEKKRMEEDARRLMSESGKGNEKDRQTLEQVRIGLGGILGRKQPINEAGVVDALEEVGKLVERREREVGSLRDEMREINMGLEEEVKRVSEDRDGWKNKVDNAEQRVGVLEKQIRVS